MRKLDSMWLACAIDTDGWLSLKIMNHHKAIYPRICIVNTNLEFLEKAESVFGGSIIARRHNNPNWKQCYTWQVGGLYIILPLLKKIIPYLIIKKNRAKLMLKFCKSREKIRGVTKNRKNISYTKKEWKIYQELKVKFCNIMT